MFGLCELSAHVAVITSYAPLAEALEVLGKPTSSNGVGKILKYPLASCIFAICKRQHIKKYMIRVHVSFVMGDSMMRIKSKLIYAWHWPSDSSDPSRSRGSYHTEHCPSHSLSPRDSSCFFSGCRRDKSWIYSTRLHLLPAKLRKQPRAGCRLLREDRTENQPTPNIHTAHRHTGNCNWPCYSLVFYCLQYESD